MFQQTDFKARKSLAVELTDIRHELADVISNNDDKLSLVADKLENIETKIEMLEENLSSSKTGCLLWKISDFTTILDDAKNGNKVCLTSKFIYTGEFGYKLKVLVYPNGVGIGHGAFMSVYVILCKTNYDLLMPWPFKNKVKIKLIDLHERPSRRSHVIETIGSDRASSSFMRPISECNPGWGFPRFISHDDLMKKSYLRENSIFLKILIQPYDALDSQKLPRD